MTNRKIALLGLGAMGSRMASRLIDAGYVLTVYNRTPERAAALVERGATLAPSPLEAAEGCDLAVSCVRDDDASKDIWLHPETGALAAMPGDAVAVESSTLMPAWVKTLGGEMTRAGVAFLDAPVVGSRPQAEAGQLIYLVGGDGETLARVRDVLLQMGGALHHVGPVGAGATFKLAVNALFGIHVAALSEMLGMLRRAGISDAEAVDVLGEMPITSPALRGIGALIAARKFEPLFPIALVEKDLRYALETSRDLGTGTPTTSTVRAVYQDAIDAGYGGDNIAGVAQLFD